ncbi:MAG: alpha-ketoacid dehydrogenase subunit beta [Gammaproteobacteria bacterium]|nr:MAG: alpha-ketoacid dehydrogenase subunit beta [Gammaproteobacteria bacterium]TLY87782.1 MAG: alpha-ketoacid dehydrogenase subunit beta [Gammaproteobacteria bacterium]
MARMNMVQALNSAMDVMLERDPRVVILGEDVGFFGGVFRVTDGLQRKYGEHRVLDTPIAEGGIIAAAIGMGVNGLKPVAEIQFADYIYPGFDQVVSELARLRYRSAGEFFAPVTIRTPCGGGIRGGQTHSQSPESIFTHVCGIKVVMPSNPYDAKGLLISSIEDEDPVVFFEPKRIYNGPFDGDPHKPAVPWSAHPRGEVPEGHYRVPIGRAALVREGKEVSVLTYGTMVHVAEAAVRLAGVDAEIVDVRSMAPLDVDTLCTSVCKTGRCVVVHEATRFSGYGAELVATVQEQCFWNLEAPVQRVTGWDTPYPHAFEWEYFPGPARIAAALKQVMEAA